MKNGKCPKCSGNDIRIIELQKEKFSHRGFLQIAMFGGPLKINEYVCMHCGFIESYFADEDMARMREAAENREWRKA